MKEGKLALPREKKEALSHFITALGSTVPLVGARGILRLMVGV